MIYEVSEGDETVRVELREIDDNVYDLSIDGKTVRCDIAKSVRTVYSVIEEGHQYEVMIDERAAHGFDVQIAGRLFHLDVVDERSKIFAEQAKKSAQGKQVIEAQMPGKVVKLNIAVGDTVKEKQPLMVVEAMKMENDIASPIAGVVTKIHVTTGDSVENGSKLITVEPPASKD